MRIGSCFPKAQAMEIKQIETKPIEFRQIEIEDEARRAHHVRFIVDFASSVIMQSSMQRAEAEALVNAARRRVLELFTGREETFEILYARRFRRLMDEFTQPDPLS